MSKYTERPAYKAWLERKRKRLNAQRQKWTRDGLCNRCGHKPKYGKRECENCRKADNAQRKERRISALQKGFCTKCHKRKHRNGSLYCRACLNALRGMYPRKYIHSRKRNKRLKEKIIEAYGGRCVCCGEREPLFLEIDHVYGGGSKQRKKIHGGTWMYSWLERHGFPKDKYQLLCRNCNYGKYRNGGKCPHKDRK